MLRTAIPVILLRRARPAREQALGALRVQTRLATSGSIRKTDFAWVLGRRLPPLGISEEEKPRDAVCTTPSPRPCPWRTSRSSKAPPDRRRVHARAYDIVCNGTEMGGGSIRIHNTEIQKRVFSFQASTRVGQSRFGFLLDACTVRGPAPRRPRPGPEPNSHDNDRRPIPPRCNRLPQDCHGSLPIDPCALRRLRKANSAIWESSWPLRQDRPLDDREDPISDCGFGIWDRRNRREDARHRSSTVGEPPTAFFRR